VPKVPRKCQIWHFHTKYDKALNNKRLTNIPQKQWKCQESAKSARFGTFKPLKRLKWWFY